MNGACKARGHLPVRVSFRPLRRAWRRTVGWRCAECSEAVPPPEPPLPDPSFGQRSNQEKIGWLLRDPESYFAAAKAYERREVEKEARLWRGHGRTA